MAVKTYAELHSAVKEILKDNNSDEALAILEDFQDSESSVGTGKKYQYDEDMEAKVQETETYWREKYKNRFYHGEETIKDDPCTPGAEKLPEEDKPEIHVKDLFKEATH